MKFYPEGHLIDKAENKASMQTPAALSDAMRDGKILEARSIICDNEHNLIVDLKCMRGIIPREEGGYLVDGQCPFYDFLAYFDREELYNEYNYNTLSGLILDLLERIPATGERFAWKEFDMDGARIDKVLVTMNIPVTEE